ncbi:MAG: hypothetical protein ACLQGP_25155 [Isosphaeraceae bacterium]
MSDDADNLLEVDRIDEVLEGTDQPQPVVVIQYKKKGLPSSWVMALFVLIPIGGMLFYYHREVKRLESKERAAKRDFESWKERFRIETVQEELIPIKRVIAGSSSAESAGPILDKSSAIPPDSGNGKGASVGIIESRVLLHPVGMVTVPETKSSLTVASSAVDAPAQSLDPSPSTPSSMEPAKTQPNDSPSPLEASPLGSVEPSGPSLGAATVGAPSVVQPSPATSPARADVADARAQPSPIEPGSGPAATGGPPGTPVAVQPEPPLPSKEETLRMIEEEAAQKKDEIRRQVSDQAVEIRRLRDEERLRFHRELREALDSFGRQAGPAIDQLCVRYGYESDSRRVSQGTQFWFASTKPFAYRARWIREKLDLPETAILNFISDGLYARLHTPGGPRDRNELRVRAAHILLTCSPTDSGESSRMTANDPRTTPSANRRPSNPPSRADAVARPR